MNLKSELLCGEQLLFEINMRKSLILVLRYIATISTCNHLIVHGKQVALLRKLTPFSATSLGTLCRTDLKKLLTFGLKTSTSFFLNYIITLNTAFFER